MAVVVGFGEVSKIKLDMQHKGPFCVACESWAEWLQVIHLVLVDSLQRKPVPRNSLGRNE